MQILKLCRRAYSGLEFRTLRLEKQCQVLFRRRVLGLGIKDRVAEAVEFACREKFLPEPYT